MLYLYHENLCSEYSLQSCHNYLHTKKQSWLEGFSLFRIKSIFVEAHSEIRRSRIFVKHGYYNSEKFEVPKYMELPSLMEAVDLRIKSEIDLQLQKGTVKESQSKK